MKRTQGFTLIEILIVLGLIALALALAWPKPDNAARLPGQFAETLAGFLNATSAAADSRQTQVCARKGNGVVITVPEVQTNLKIPPEIVTDMNQVCFTAAGVPTTNVNIGIRHTKQTSYNIYIKSEGAYGRIGVSR